MEESVSEERTLEAALSGLPRGTQGVSECDAVGTPHFPFVSTMSLGPHHIGTIVESGNTLPLYSISDNQARL